MDRQVTVAPRRLGVLGAGVMGAGIAQLGCLAKMETFLVDSSPEALESAEQRIRRDLARGADRGRWSSEAAEEAIGWLRPAGDVEALSGVELVIEAVPEDLDIKASVLAGLPGDPVIATNTSSLSITEIAARLPRPQRVVGMHFFNPPPLMKLVEVVAGSQTEPAAVSLVQATAAAMGRTPILTRDAIGFVVNRCGRPFYTEALRLLEEGVADASQIDRICRMGAGFRMGPFELMDLVGLDTGLAVAETFTVRSLGEPRWKPSFAQRRKVAAGTLGRKTGSGWFDYAGDPRPDDPAPLTPAGGGGRLISILGFGPEHEALCAAAEMSGFKVSRELEVAGPILTIICDHENPIRHFVPDRPTAVSCATRSLAAIAARGAVGFHVLPPAAEARLIELTRLPNTSVDACGAIEELAPALGLHAEWVKDAPGLVLGRIVAQLVNEACFALGEGVASSDDVDLGTTLGLNHPFGPVEWGERIGWPGVRDRIDGIWSERHEERYRLAPLLLRAAELHSSPRDLLDPDADHGAWR
jgi:3-hydroxybutyryl-CoA dehydrogenase